MDESFETLDLEKFPMTAEEAASVEVPKRFIRQMKTPLFKPAYEERVKAILHHHNCYLEVRDEYCIITFPPGTTTEQLWGNATCDRNKIVLPDGYDLLEMAIPNSDLSNPGFPPEDFADIHA
ncbi:hypothetical protein [Tengunoibacter tsumagoiensis]|uniref:Uncharacterized protein n=1 Tax=Tengunoibacter tsumagoiensis TaxID=2014871 RepID=A0A401ZWC0_9CHLR|nr:hypothetical protein [Tengunoibacter tsumagoiensis]GCE11070.1 hypothetical protein KTT_09290 [Tengunoibacter tsumagoiensis]